MSEASAVIDSANGYAYFGFTDYATTVSAGIMKVRLSDLTRVGTLLLSAGEVPLSTAAIDSANGYAYFGTATDPGNIVKVRLSDFTRVGALTLKQGEGYLHSAVIDSVNGYAYFGTNIPAFGPNISPDVVVKVRLSDFTQVGSLILNAGENYLESAAIDPGNGYGYFGTYTVPGIVVKVKLPDLTRVGALSLNTGEDNLTSAVIDSANGYAYFGTDLDKAPGIIVKVRLSDLTRVGSLTLNLGEKRLKSAVIDTANGYAYFGTTTSPGIVVKVETAATSTLGFDYSLSNNGPLTTQAGSSDTVTITTTLTTGAPQPVTLSCTSLPSGISCGSFTANPVAPSASGARSDLTVNVASSVVAGTYSFQVIGSPVGQATSPSTVSVTVTSPSTPNRASNLILGLDPTIFYVIVGAVVAVIITSVALLYWRFGKPKRQVAK
jgi:hypothetical protein